MTADRTRRALLFLLVGCSVAACGDEPSAPDVVPSRAASPAAEHRLSSSPSTGRYRFVGRPLLVRGTTARTVVIFVRVARALPRTRAGVIRAHTTLDGGSDDVGLQPARGFARCYFQEFLDTAPSPPPAAGTRFEVVLKVDGRRAPVASGFAVTELAASPDLVAERAQQRFFRRLGCRERER